ncbi:MAG TPA: universal stress protein [Anaerolineales bacterium]|nr:universal stress protein [Anaerolineales bacterium]
MEINPDYQLAIRDFQSAHLRAKLQGVLARITGRSNELLSYDEIASKLKLQGRSDKGLQTIAVDAIIGSVGRYTDFTRTFLPRRRGDQERWANVKTATLDPVGPGWEPIEVYRVSEVYFVLDGNHRVSIARQEGWKAIEAHVIEIQTDILLTPDVRPDELIVKAEYADFLEQTSLNKTQEQVDLRLTMPGGYQKLLDEVCVRRCQMQEEDQKECTLQDSAVNWYRNIYLPFAEAVRERGMMRWFPDRTITDLYVWMSEHRVELEKELGWSIRPEAAAGAVIQRKNPRATSEETRTGSWRKARLLNRYSEHLFRDILVPISSPENWDALEQAIPVARREEAHIYGLHIVNSQAELNSPEAIALQNQFNQICEKEKIQGALAIEIGDPTQKILERAALTDLIVMKVAYPPSTGIKALTSHVRTLTARSSRPILAIPGKVSSLNHTLLAFDGSPKSREALFVATYLAEQWKTELTVFIGLDDEKLNSSAQDFAQNYLEFNEIEAHFLTQGYFPETLKMTAEEIKADLIIMGGYSGSILKEMTVGSSVNFMLRESQFPILICR